MRLHLPLLVLLGALALHGCDTIASADATRTATSTATTTSTSTARAASEQGPQSPDEIFAAAKLVEWFRADLGIADGGGGAGVVNSWTGQKAGIALTAPAEANRCVLTAAHASFNNQPTVNSSASGTNYLIVTGLGTPIWTSATDPYVLAIMRSAVDFNGGGFDTLLSFGGATTNRIWLLLPSSGVIRRRIVHTGGTSDKNITVDPTTPALIRFGYDGGDTSTGNLYAHNATVDATTGANQTLTQNVTQMVLGAQGSGGDQGDIEAAEIVLLNAFPTAGELSAYQAYATARYGVPP